MEVTKEMLKKARAHRRLYKRILCEISEVEGSGGFKPNREIDRLKAEAERMRGHIEAVEAFINSIEDLYARRIMRAKYLDGLTWRAIAMNVGGRNTADSVRMYASRYLSHMKIK